MLNSTRIGIEQARIELPRLVSEAQAGNSAIITRHGRPCAAIVPLDALPTKNRRGGVLALRGTGAGLWGPSIASTVTQLRNEWD
jgi:prevent-host-death family protein